MGGFGLRKTYECGSALCSDRLLGDDGIDAGLCAFFLLLRAADADGTRDLAVDDDGKRTGFGEVVDPDRGLIALRGDIFLERFRRALPMSGGLGLEDGRLGEGRSATLHRVEVHQY